jgi:hypothetical protein
MAVFDTMRHIRPDVSTVCVGLAASMGAFLLASGHQGKRYSLPNSRIMIHQPLGGAQGQAADIEIQVGAGLCCPPARRLPCQLPALHIGAPACVPCCVGPAPACVPCFRTAGFIAPSSPNPTLQANEILHHKLTLNGYLAEFTGQGMDTITADTDRDFFMSAQEAVGGKRCAACCCNAAVAGGCRHCTAAAAWPLRAWWAVGRGKAALTTNTLA